MLFSLLGLVVTSFFPGILIADLLIKNKKSVGEFISISILISLVINFIIVFYFSLISYVSLTGFLFFQALICLAIIMIRAIRNKRFSLSLELRPKFKFPEALAWAFVLVVLLLQFVYSGFFPFISYDAVASYNSWAREIYELGHFSNFDYPQFLSSLYAIPYLFGGLEAENLSHLLVFLSGLAGLFYVYRLTEELGGSGVLSLAIILMTPWLLIHFNSGYSELMLMSFCIATLYYLNSYLENEKTKHVVLVGFLAGGAALIKIHGLYVPFGAAAVILVVQYLKKRSLNDSLPKTFFLLLVSLLFVLHWYALDFASGDFYLQKAFFLRSSGSAEVVNWGTEELAKNYLLRPMVGIDNITKNHSFPIIIVLLSGFAFMLYSVFRVRLRFYPISIFSILYTILWLFMLSFMIRGLAIAYPGIVIASSVVLSNFKGIISKRLAGIFRKRAVFVGFTLLILSCAICFYIVTATNLTSINKFGGMGCFPVEKIKSSVWIPLFLISFLVAAVYALRMMLMKTKTENLNTILSLFMIPILLYPAAYSVYFSYIGLTIGCVKTTPRDNVFSLALQDNEHKLHIFLDGFYDVVSYIKKHDSFQKSSILTVDARVKAFLRDHNLSSEHPDYIIYKNGATYRDWNRPFWAGTEIDEDLRNNSSKYFTEIFSSGPYHIYDVNYTAIEEFYQKQPTAS